MRSVRDICREIMAKVMEVSESNIKNETNQDNINQWDSLKHIALISELEEVFQIEISPEESVEKFTNFKSIVSFIEKKYQRNE